MQAQAQYIVGLLGSLDHLLQLGEDVAVQVSEEHPVDVQGIGPAEAGGGEQRRTSSSGRSIPGGRWPSGVASGRVTSSGTTFGCARANRRKS